MPSTFITWIFAKSINNSATLGGRFGLLGGIAYAGPSCRVIAPESWLYQEERAWGSRRMEVGVGVTTPRTCRTKLSPPPPAPSPPLPVTDLPVSIQNLIFALASLTMVSGTLS